MVYSHVRAIPKYVNFYRHIMPGRMAEIIDLTVDSKRLKTHGVESLLEKHRVRYYTRHITSTILLTFRNLINFIFEYFINFGVTNGSNYHLRLDHAYGRGLTREGQKLTPKKMYTSSFRNETHFTIVIKRKLYRI